MKRRDRILLSVHPRHCDSILAGTKLFEFRRAVPAQQPKMVSIYSTAPVRGIVGEFEVADVLCNAPDVLWEHTKAHAGITHDEFLRYFSGKLEAFAFEVANARRFAEPIDPRAEAAARGLVFNPPQSFCYWPPEGW